MTTATPTYRRGVKRAWLERKSSKPPTLDQLLTLHALGQLTERDLDILEVVYHAGGAAMTHQIAEIVFDLESERAQQVKTCQRLRLLFENFLLGRTWPMVLESTRITGLLSRISVVHYLGPSSTSLLAYRTGLTNRQIGRIRAVGEQLINSQRLLHSLFGVDIWIEFVRAARRSNWKVEWRSSSETYQEASEEQGKTKKTSSYIPDGLALVEHNGRVTPFLIEADTGSERGKRFTRKFTGLALVYKAGAYQRQYGVFPVILVVTGTPTRANALTEELRAGAGRVPVRFLVASMTEIRAKGLELAAWQEPGRTVTQQLPLI